MDEFDLKTEEGDNDYYQDDGPLDGVDGDGTDGQYQDQDYQEDPSVENGGGDSLEANGNGANGDVDTKPNLASNNTGSDEQQQQQNQQSTTPGKPGKSKDDDKWDLVQFSVY